MLKKTLITLTLAGCASADTVKEQAKAIEALTAEVTQLKQDLGLASPEKTEGDAEGEAKDGKKAAEPKRLGVRLTDLENQIKLLEKRVASGKGGAPTMSKEDQEKLSKLYKESQELKKEGKNKEAAAKLREVIKLNPQLARRIQSQITELEVIGTAVSGKLNVNKWLIDSKSGGKIDLSKGVTYLVFWELWCPHCKREIPNLEATYKELSGKGLNMVGLTTLSRNKSEEEVGSFLKESKVTYPIATHDGKINETFKVGGIPAAALVKDGKIIWRGHPSGMSKDQLLKHIQG